MKRLTIITLLSIINLKAFAQPVIDESIRQEAAAAVKSGAFPSLVQATAPKR